MIRVPLFFILSLYPLKSPAALLSGMHHWIPPASTVTLTRCRSSWTHRESSGVRGQRRLRVICLCQHTAGPVYSPELESLLPRRIIMSGCMWIAARTRTTAHLRGKITLCCSLSIASFHFYFSTGYLKKRRILVEECLDSVCRQDQVTCVWPSLQCLSWIWAGFWSLQYSEIILFLVPTQAICSTTNFVCFLFD